jgi:4-hydroxybenzoate polyprenyltransferase
LEKHQGLLLGFSSVFAGMGTILATQLTSLHLLVALAVTTAAIAYLLLAQAFPKVRRGLLPRELSVGVFFAVAVGLFTFREGGRDLPPLFAFALLCAANGVAISLDEKERDLERGDVTLATTHKNFGDSQAQLLHGGLLVAGLALLLGESIWKASPKASALTLCFGLALVFLALVPWMVREKGLRPAAYDLALCTPLLVW